MAEIEALSGFGHSGLYGPSKETEGLADVWDN